MSAADFHRNLHQVRRYRRLTVAEAAKRAGVSVPSWYKYESGNQFPSAKTIDAIASAMNVRPKRLLDDVID